MSGELKCIVCGKELEPAVPDGPAAQFGVKNQPFGGTTFRTQGHYGSTVFDPLNDLLSLEINVCDEDLLKAAARGLVYVVSRTPQPDDYHYEKWVGSSRVDLQACKLEYSIVSPK